MKANSHIAFNLLLALSAFSTGGFAAAAIELGTGYDSSQKQPKQLCVNGIESDIDVISQDDSVDIQLLLFPETEPDWSRWKEWYALARKDRSFFDAVTAQNYAFQAASLVKTSEIQRISNIPAISFTGEAAAMQGTPEFIFTCGDEMVTEVARNFGMGILIQVSHSEGLVLEGHMGGFNYASVDGQYVFRVPEGMTGSELSQYTVKVIAVKASGASPIPVITEMSCAAASPEACMAVLNIWNRVGEFEEIIAEEGYFHQPMKTSAYSVFAN